MIDRAIPSYTPTIRALTHARRPRASASGGKNGEATGADDRIVVVAMPHTPGSSALPGVQEEAAEIQKRFPGQVTVLTGVQATHDTVLTALTTRQPGAIHAAIRQMRQRRGLNSPWAWASHIHVGA